jgi:hypothetical protein
MREAYWAEPDFRPNGGTVSLEPAMQPTSDAPRSRFRLPPWLLILLVVVVLATGVAVVLARQGDDPAAEVGAGAKDATTTTSVAEAAPEASPTRPASPSKPGISSDVSAAQRALFEELMAQTSEIRGLSWKESLNLRIVSHDELVRRHAEATARDLDPTRIAATEATLKLLGLFPADVSYQRLLDDIVRSGAVLGFYDSKTRELFVKAEGELDSQVKATIVHEMVHALTDQNFAYGPRIDALDRADRAEESFAFSSLLEGDARLTETLWMDRHLDPLEALAIALGIGGSGGGGEALLNDAPPYFVKSLLFPYTEGLAFVESLHRAGGFAAVDGAYRRPPTSTEHIIHPSTYSSGQTPAVPPLPDVAAATGCRAVRSGMMGEFDMRELLGAELGVSEAQQAAQGWNGDAYSLVRCGSTLGLADRWQTDPGVDASRLADALSRWARGWSGGRGPGADGRFSGPSGAGRITRTGNQVELVLARDGETADRLVRALG